MAGPSTRGAVPVVVNHATRLRPIDLSRFGQVVTALQAAPDLDDIDAWTATRAHLVFATNGWLEAGYTEINAKTALVLLLKTKACGNPLATRLMLDVVTAITNGEYTMDQLLSAVQDRFFGAAYRTYWSNVVHGQQPYDSRNQVQLSKYLRPLYSLMVKANLDDAAMRTTVVRLLSGSALERWQSYLARSTVDHVGEAILVMETEERFKEAGPFVHRRLPANLATVNQTVLCPEHPYADHPASRCFKLHPELRPDYPRRFAPLPVAGRGRGNNGGGGPHPGQLHVPRCNKCGQLGHKFGTCPSAAMIAHFMSRVQQSRHPPSRGGHANAVRAARPDRRTLAAVRHSPARLSSLTYSEAMRLATPTPGMETDIDETASVNAATQTEDMGEETFLDSLQWDTAEADTFGEDFDATLTEFDDQFS